MAGSAYTGVALDSPRTPMCRSAIVVLVLAALSVASANGSTYIPARAHKCAPALAVSKNSRKKPRQKTAQALRRAHGRLSWHEPGHTNSHLAGFPSAGKPAVNKNPSIQSPKQPLRAHEAGETAHSGGQPGADAAPVSRVRLAAPPPLRGSRQSLTRQNEKSEADSLERIEDGDDLRDRIARKMLVPVPVSATLAVSGNLPPDNRYCRPWTAGFLADLARAHAARFHRPLTVSSAVRTVEYQKQLMEINGNAAKAEGEIVSPHLTGATIDIAKQGLSRLEVSWLRRRLLPLQTAGKIDVEEEFQQACFHITVYKSYAPLRPPAPAREPSRNRSAPLVQIAARGR